MWDGPKSKLGLRSGWESRGGGLGAHTRHMRALFPAAGLAALTWLTACGGGQILDPVGGPRAEDVLGRDGGAASGGGSGASDAADGGTVQTGPYVASASEARRLSRTELDNTLRDLLGDSTAPASKMLSEDRFTPFDNDYTTQRASGALVDSLELLARAVATRALANTTQRSQVVPCMPASNGDQACFERTVRELLPRAFRRPVTDAEVDAYLPLLDYATEDNPDVPHDFYTAVELLLRSVLQDPEFLYRIERGTDLDDHAIASRLSYLLWATMPDAQLFAEAKAGRLTDASSRRQIASRMLKDARAKQQLRRFHAMWLGYRAIPQSAELAAAFQRETSALIDRVVFDQPESYLNVFTKNETYLDDALAAHYGLPRPAGGEGWVAYGDSGRAGILSHGSVLAAFSKFSDTSPTQRGIFVRTRLLCETLKPPPPDVMADQPPSGNDDAICKYDRYKAHRTSVSCASCHALTDGIGFGLENYDIAGRFRTHDDGQPECEIAGEGTLVGIGDFSGPAELGALLVDEGLVEPCIVQQVFQFAIGRPPEGNELDAIQALTTTFAGADHDFQALLLSIIESDAFARRLEPAP
jgi:Protein of unknown function (DUF1592)/Protein of unknown function (DUF1588)/Protein of unknown function (DUF1595)/Protein of unknown function (DUF1585)/Protein of unknown function (DUF1587)